MHWDAGSNSVTTKNFSPWIETRNEMRAGKQWKKRIKKRRKQFVEIISDRSMSPRPDKKRKAGVASYSIANLSPHHLNDSK